MANMFNFLTAYGLTPLLKFLNSTLWSFDFIRYQVVTFNRDVSPNK